MKKTIAQALSEFANKRTRIAVDPTDTISVRKAVDLAKKDKTLDIEFKGKQDKLREDTKTNINSIATIIRSILEEALRASSMEVSISEVQNITSNSFTIQIEHPNKHKETYKFSLDVNNNLSVKSPQYLKGMVKNLGQVKVQASSEVLANEDLIKGNLVDYFTKSTTSSMSPSNTISKSELKEIIEEAYFEVLEQSSILRPASQEILGKFRPLKRALVDLLTVDFADFVKDIKWVAPKPSTFEIILQNGERFFLRWDGVSTANGIKGGFTAQIAGKSYNLPLVSEFQQALKRINDLLKTGPIRTISDMEAEEEADSEFTSGDFGGGDFGGGDFGADEFGADEFGGEEPLPDEFSDEIEFEEPGEEPEPLSETNKKKK